MSDYLAHLLERSFAHPPEVRPQRPSLFEPAPATGLAEPPADSEPTLETEAKAPALPPPPGETPTVRRAPSEFAEPVVPERWVDRPKRDRVSESLAPKAVTVPAPQGTPPVIAREILAPVDVPADREAPARDRSFPFPQGVVVAEKSVAPRADPSPLSTASSRNAEVPERTLSPAAVDGPPERPKTLQRASDPRRNGDGPIEGIVIRPAILAPENAPFPPFAPGRKETAPFLPDTHPAVPTIQVTIGRVEVRAALPPPARRPGAKKEPQMSLESYLQRRSEGGRK